MEMSWSLKELYPSFQSNELKTDIEKLKACIEDFKKWSEEILNNPNNAKGTIEEYVKIQIELKRLTNRLFSFASLTQSVEAKNEDASKLLEKIEKYETETTKPEVKFQKWLGGLDNANDIINSSDFLREHSFYLGEIKNKAQYLLDEGQEVIISKMKNTGANSWSKLQKLLTSTLLVDINIDGEQKKLPITVVSNMVFDSDPAVRKNAFFASEKAYDTIAESIASCLNGIKGEVITLSKLRGYESPLHETLVNSRMDKETLDAMLSAMRESLPAFRKYYKKKAELLGHKNGLPFYDISAPIGNSSKTYTYEEAHDFLIENFNKFSGKLADFVDHAFKSRWIDAAPKDGKRGGAFCSNLHSIGESRILCTFTGKFKNVTTLAHELGHGYHGLCLKNQSILNSRYPMPIAETASIFNETIITNAALKTASKDESVTILESSISSAGQVIVDILSRFIFESEVFKRREESSLSLNEINEIMLEAQREAYGDGLDANCLNKYAWINKPHYYYPERNFYNFPYAFGLLFSKGLYAEYLKRGDAFVKQYDELLKATGRMNVRDVALSAGIDVHSIDFWRSSLKLIEEEIEQFIAIV